MVATYPEPEERPIRRSSCEGCGKTGEDVRPCCAWEGARTSCPSCYLNPEKRTPGHVCGVGIITERKR